MSTTKRLVAYHMARLQDKDVNVRLKAIKELELLGDPECLEALRDVYDNDINVDVRKAAQEAGRSVFLKNQAPEV